MKQAGISVPRVSWDQLAMGQRTDLSKLQPGDFIGFGDGGHIALYLGGGQILEAPRTGLDVRVRSLGQGENAWGVSLSSLYK
jgi:cell wall-associated NlpC family hydrolase